MKEYLIELLNCPNCSGSFHLKGDQMVCSDCQTNILVRDGIPVFSNIPVDIVPSNKKQRGIKEDTPWRSANARFLQAEAQKLPPEALILDIGAGRGDFADLFSKHRYIANDIYPYPETDIVCDLTQVNPFAPGSMDMILLLNVLEHLPNAEKTIQSMTKLLRPQGRILVTVPFLVKIHQAPYDFVRYTQYFLRKLGEEAGLKVDSIEGYYDPVFLVGESERYIRFWALSRYSLIRRRIIMGALAGLRVYRFVLEKLIGPGYLADVETAFNPAPVGYHVIYRKEDK